MGNDVLKISDFIDTQHIFLDLDLSGKDAVLKFIAATACEKGLVKDEEALYDGLKKREESMSTGVGAGLAFPHTTMPERNEASVMILRLIKPVPFDAIDDQPVDVIFAIIIPESNQTQHLQILARVSRLCRKPEFLNSVRRKSTPSALKEAIIDLEEEITGFFYQA